MMICMTPKEALSLSKSLRHRHGWTYDQIAAYAKRHFDINEAEFDELLREAETKEALQ